MQRNNLLIWWEILKNQKGFVLEKVKARQKAKQKDLLSESINPKIYLI